MATDALSLQAIQGSMKRTQAERIDQYSLWQILGIWASAALPMGIAYWVILPILYSRGNMNPFMFLFLTTLGMVWQGVVSYFLLRGKYDRLPGRV